MSPITITFQYWAPHDSILVRWSWSPDWLERFKSLVPAWSRRYHPEAKMWEIPEEVLWREIEWLGKEFRIHAVWQTIKTDELW